MWITAKIAADTTENNDKMTYLDRTTWRRVTGKLLISTSLSFLNSNSVMLTGANHKNGIANKVGETGPKVNRADRDAHNIIPKMTIKISGKASNLSAANYAR